jgi:hypothetical protein
MTRLKAVIIGIVLSFWCCFAMEMTYEMKGGLNFSKFYGSDSENDETLLPGICVGANAGFPVNGFFSFEPEILLSFKGVHYPDAHDVVYYYGRGFTYPVDIENSRTRLIYIDIPLNSRITVFKQSPAKIYMLLGPYASFLASARQKATAIKTIQGGSGTAQVENVRSNELMKTNAYTDKILINQDERKEYSSFDFGITLGAGLLYDIGKGSIVIEVRQSLGFLSVDNDKKDDLKNMVINVSAGYHKNF